MYHWVIVMRDTALLAVGPFADMPDARIWARDHAWGPGGRDTGDPRWQIIALEDPPNVAIQVVTPENADIPA